MITFTNKYENEVKIFTDQIDDTSLAQITELANCEPYAHSKIRIMPDVHAGKGCTIGTTMTIRDCITPNLVGVDIGCGMLTIELNISSVDFKTLDKIIYELIPHGFDIHKHPSDYDFSDLRCANNPDIDLYRGQCSLGTLGGGNHFIEIDKDDNGTLYLIIHSGSRNIGLSVATHYQKIAENTNRCQENRELSFLTNNDFSNYIHDVKIMQQFASDNRKRMAEIILATMGWIAKNQFETIHNYIDTDKMILRKGAIRAEKDERVLIPINMKDGCIIARGHGNPDWNFSAPHGAGRVLSRTQAKKQLSMNTFQNSMKGIYTTSVKKSTLDESPEAYKSISDILSWINDSVTVEKIIKPIYNFKA